MPNIMIIEDDVDFRAMLTRMLQLEDYSVTTASNGKKALELYDQNLVDLVITDIFMPEKEGIETIIELKKINRDIKIIAISGGGWKGETSYLKYAVTLGAQAIFEKPVDNEELIDKVNELINR